VPVAVRQALRRPADPGGTTVPAGLCPRVSQELVPFLPSEIARFRPGDRPLADWVLVELLGKGRFGEVWKARHRTDLRQRPVTLKFCLDPVAASRLRSEVAVRDTLDRVRRQGAGGGLVPLLKVHRDTDPPCLVYEHVEGSDLAGLIREMHPGGRLTPEVVFGLMQDLAGTPPAPTASTRPWPTAT
jgi:serine/threonine protein kinase